MTLASRHHRGQMSFGVTLTIADPFVAEVVAAQSFDFLLIDTEHSPMSPFQVQTQLIALRSSAATLLVRVPDLDATRIMQMLDMGADGVVVPQVESAAQCRTAVQAAFYPPLGNRGVGPRRAARLSNRQTYLASANSHVDVLVMIESAAGVANLNEILVVPGLGGVIVGAADLAASLGHLGETNHADVTAAIDLVFARCAAANVPFGMYAGSASEASAHAAKGARIITVGSDLLFLEQGMARVNDSMDKIRDWHIHDRSGAQQPSDGSGNRVTTRSQS
jgi:2-keto-3-deoxy-L-rhamnonate aldolase RhmA